MALNPMFLPQAAASVLGGGYTPEQPKKKRPYYTGAIPEIAKAYGEDPRTKLAESAITTGTSTAPVAQGGWAVTDGLARVAQAVLGAYLTKKQGQKYGDKEHEMIDALKASASLAQGPQRQQAAQPQFTNPTQGTKPPEAMAAQALAPAQMAPPAAPQGLGAPGTGTGPPAPSIPALSGPGAAQMGVPSGPTSPRVLSPGQSARAPGRTPVADFKTVPVAIAKKYGLNPVDVAAIMSYETAGTFSPTKMGGKGGNYMGLIQFGPEERRTFGINRRSTPEQWTNAIDGFLTQRGFKPGMSTLDLYSTINAGRPGKYNASDGNGTVQSHHDKIMAEHRTNGANFIGASAGQSYNANEDVSAVGQTAVPAPQMEAGVQVPDMPLQAPSAPALPDPVKSQRVQMAQQMLESDNPFLVQQARAYLDKGMDENFESSKLANEQRFQQGQTGYQAGLNDFTGARTDFRQNQYQEGRDVKARNFGRESDYNTRTFSASESAADRSSRAAIASADRAGTRSNIEYQEGQQNSRTAATIQGKAQTDQERRAEKRNIYLNTPTGLKMQDKVNTEINANEGAIGQFQRFLELNKRQGTGGLVLNTPVVGSTFSSYNNDLSEMKSIANKTTLSEIGGSLGVAISDGDRKFISESNIAIGSPGNANGKVARAAIAGLRRKNDYLNEFQSAQIDDTQADFYKEWRVFAESTPIVKNGRVATTEPITFQEWRKSRPQYDINGKKVN